MIQTRRKRNPGSVAAETQAATQTVTSIAEPMVEEVDSAIEDDVLNTSSEITAEEPLTGKALLARIAEMPDKSRREKAVNCGYVKRTADRTFILFTQFQEAILAAKGVMQPKLSKKELKSRGRNSSFVTQIQKQGQLLIGSAYTKPIGYKPGDRFVIRVFPQKIVLELVK